MNNHKERDHALLSASSAYRWLECPPSAVAAEMYTEVETEFAAEGTLAHEVAEAIADGATSKQLAEMRKENPDITVEMIECAEAYREYIHTHSTSKSITLLEQRVDFSPWVPDGFGTCDCIIIHDETLIIIDYKYGVGVPVSATDNPQMKLYALGAMNDFGFAYDVKKVEMHIFQPRINNTSDFELTTEALLTWAEKTVKPIAQKAIKGKGKYKAGSHCKFCPHAGRCRTLTKTCREYVETHSLRAAVPVLAPHEVAEVLSMEPLISVWRRAVTAQAMTTLLNGGDVPGYKVVEGRGTRTWTEDIKVVNTLLGDGLLMEDITRTELLSPAALEKVLGKKKVAELLGQYITKKTGAPALASIKDTRPAFDKLAEAQKDFAD